MAEDVEVKAGNIGVLIRVDTGEDLTSATRYDIRLLCPDGTTEKHFASPGETTRSGTEIRYTTIDRGAGEPDLPQGGQYKVISDFALPGGFDGYGTTGTFEVKDKFG